MVTMRNHWTRYHKWLQKGKWSWLALARQFVRLVLASVQCHVVHLAIEDTPCVSVDVASGSSWTYPSFVHGLRALNTGQAVGKGLDKSS